MRVKNQTELEKFSGIILSIQYKELPPKKEEDLPKYYSRLEIETFTDCNGNDTDKTTYLAELKVQEVKGGRRPRKHRFSMTVYIDEDTFITEDLHEGDILSFDKVKFATDNFNVKVYDTEKLKDYPKAKIRKDENGRVYSTMKVQTFKMACPLGSWKRKFKFDELYYFTIDRVKFFQTCEQDFNQTEWEMCLDKSEYSKLQSYNGQEVLAKCYAKKVKISEFNAKIELSEDKPTERYFCKITKILSEN